MNVQEALEQIVEAHVCYFEPVKELGAGVPFVFLLQDAYVLDCQKQLVRAIRILAANGLKLIAEEGYDGRVPSAEYFGFIKDPQVKKRVAAHLLVEQRLGAAEFCDVIQEPPVDVWGVDDIDLHMQMIGDYKQAFTLSDRWRHRFMALSQRLVSDGLGSLSKELRTYFESHPKRGLSSRLDAEGSDSSIDLLLEIQFLQDFGRKTGLMDDELPDLSGALLSMVQGQQPDIRALHDRLLYSHAAITQRLASTDRDRQFLGILSRLELFCVLFRLDCTFDDATEVSGENSSLENLCDQCDQLIPGTPLIDEMRGDEGAFRDAHNAAIDYYELLMERADSIARNLLELAQLKGEEGHYIALVVGGAHRSVVESVLRAKHISHVVLTPHMVVKSEESDAYNEKMISDPLNLDGPININAEAIGRFLRDIDGWRPGFFAKLQELFRLRTAIKAEVAEENYERAATLKQNIQAIEEDVEMGGTELEKCSLLLLDRLLQSRTVCQPVKTALIENWSKMQDSEAVEDMVDRIAFVTQTFEAIDDWRVEQIRNDMETVNSETDVLEVFGITNDDRASRTIGLDPDSWLRLAESGETDAAMRTVCYANLHIQLLPKRAEEIYRIAELLRSLELDAQASEIEERYVDPDNGQLVSMSMRGKGQYFADDADQQSGIGNALITDSLRRELAELEKKFGLKHPHTIGKSNQLARALEDQQDLDGAEQEYRRALERAPDDIVVLGNFGFFLQNARRNYQASYECYERAVQSDPNDAVNRCNFGGLCIVMNRWAEAETHLRTAWQLTVKNPDQFTPRILFLRAALAALHDQATEIFFGQLKTLFQRGIEPAPSRNVTVLESLSAALTPEPLSLFEAVFSAINEPGGMQRLETDPQWKNLPLQALDASWPPCPLNT